MKCITTAMLTLNKQWFRNREMRELELLNKVNEECTHSSVD